MQIFKKVLTKLKENIPGFIIGIILAITITVVCASGLLSSTVTYDNTNSGLSATTVQDALDELNEMADNQSDGAYVYAYNTSNVYYTGTGQSTLNSLGTVYGTMEALSTATGKNIGLKYKIEDNMVTEAYVCTYYDVDEEYCFRGYTDGTYFESNKTSYNDYIYYYHGDESFFCSSNSSCGGDVFIRDIVISFTSSGQVLIEEDVPQGYCYVQNTGYAYCR